MANLKRLVEISSLLTVLIFFRTKYRDRAYKFWLKELLQGWKLTGATGIIDAILVATLPILLEGGVAVIFLN